MSADSSALKALWRDRCLEARRQFEVARLRVDVLNSSAMLGDSNAYRDALEAASATLAEYSRVLRLYTDLMVHGKIPDEIPPKSKRATVE